MKRIGIDAGGSLVKVVYEEKGRRHYKTFEVAEIGSILNWLHLIAPEAHYFVTGGSASQLKDKLSTMTEVPEFDAVCKGAQVLLNEELELDESFLLVSIGTGTSYFIVEPGSGFNRLLGSGIGGGTFMGLGNMLTGVKEFNGLVELASKGDRTSVDLMVKDLYTSGPTPIPGHLTASNFAKGKRGSYAVEDAVRALINMIAETTVLMANGTSKIHGIRKWVFVGSTVNGNQPLKDDLTQFQDMIPYEPIFLTHGAYAGAVGALVNRNNY
ncbi:type II pantothenate kinase [Bacillus pakistanensis]|uniref:Type II pantothenate kinase n=1 Tax=Rossellomorea pakistanensis TaxID=992288 RepID=A0ABS2NGW8_9BACI|nr:type II pantothenate kinase [Bacillus pakistanensis]MBM7587014.1 type II pantothenate kinase [Bacillus pakistanensis]